MAVVVESAVWRHDSAVRGHHVYKRMWTPRIGEVLEVDVERGNIHDRYAVSVLKEGTVVGHAPRELSRYLWFFIDNGGRITCEVTGRRK